MANAALKGNSEWCDDCGPAHCWGILCVNRSLEWGIAFPRKSPMGSGGAWWNPSLHSLGKIPGSAVRFRQRTGVGAGRASARGAAHGSGPWHRARAARACLRQPPHSMRATVSRFALQPLGLPQASLIREGLPVSTSGSPLASIDKNGPAPPVKQASQGLRRRRIAPSSLPDSLARSSPQL